MKKIIISIFSSLILLLFIPNTYSYELSRTDIVAMNKIISKIEKNANILWFYYRDLVIAEKEVDLRSLSSDSKEYLIINELIKKLKQIKFSTFSKNHYKENKIDFSIIKENWLTWHNDARYNSKLKTYYTYDERLDNTAFEWSFNNMEKWVMDHKRSSNSSFYDYSEIEKWFQERWVKCRVSNGVTSSENLWYHSFYCKKTDSDCSDEALKASKEIFNMFMSEKWLKYPLDAHYRTIIHKNLKYIWVWMAIKKENNNSFKDSDYYKIYITTHYCTEFSN